MIFLTWTLLWDSDKSLEARVQLGLWCHWRELPISLMIKELQVHSVNRKRQTKGSSTLALVNNPGFRIFLEIWLRPNRLIKKYATLSR